MMSREEEAFWALHRGEPVVVWVALLEQPALSLCAFLHEAPNERTRVFAWNRSVTREGALLGRWLPDEAWARGARDPFTDRGGDIVIQLELAERELTIDEPARVAG